MRPLHRYDARATIVPGEHEGTIGGSVALLRLIVTDDGPLTDTLAGRQYTRPDVFCHLNARQARQLAERLHELADQLAGTPSPIRTTP